MELERLPTNDPVVPSADSSSPPAPSGKVDRLEREAARDRDRHGRLGQRILFATDVLALSALIAGAHALTPLGTGQPHWILLGIAGLAVWLLALHLNGRYPRVPETVTASTLDEIPRALQGSLVGVLAVNGLLAIGPSAGSLWAVLVLLASSQVVLAADRLIVQAALRRLQRSTRILVVGDGPRARAVIAHLMTQRGISITDHVQIDSLRSGPAGGPRSRAVTLEELRATIVRKRIDRVVLANDDASGPLVTTIAHLVRQTGASLTFVPDHVGVFGAGATVDQLGAITGLSLQPPALSRTAQFLKRSLDVVAAATGLLVLFPAILVIAFAVRLDSPGPVLFRQKRVGRHGRPFDVLKFRTMVLNADELTTDLMAQSKDPNWLLLDHDPRITRIGRFLRGSSLDELPQLWNVLRGQMSLVGPRPLSERDATRVDTWGHQRLQLTPGITGLWQVNGRTAIPFEGMIQLDYQYVSNWSLWTDIKLLLQTLPAVTAQRGAN